MNALAQLILLDGFSARDQAREWSIEDEVTFLGRHEGCQVVLLDREVSRKHAQIRQDGIHFVLVDMGSTNGTLVNGVRIEGARRLKDGDEIIIAPRFKLRFVDGEATVAAQGRQRGLRIDGIAKSVYVAGTLLEPPLAPNQFSLLELLMRQHGKVYTRDEISGVCYPDAGGGVSDQAIDGVVRRLRTRLAEIDPDTTYVEAVRGHGFRMVG
jgi:hypothetical protein